MLHLKQNMISLAIILAVVTFIGWIGQKPPLAPAGLVSIYPEVKIDIKEHYTAQQVNLYQVAPAITKTLGEVTAELAFDPKQNEQQQIDALVNYVRGLAANAGANGIVVNVFAPRGNVLYFSGQLIKT